MPHDLLRAIGRPTTGRAYQLLGQALDRLQSTTVKTNIRAINRKEITFSWIDSYTHLVDERTERTRGMSVTLARWFYDGVIMEGGVLSIDPTYFDITGGRERWLYRVARKHAGGAGEAGFAISFPTLFEKSGAEGSYRRFKFELLAIAKRDTLPSYQLVVEKKGGEPTLRMIRRDQGTIETRRALVVEPVRNKTRTGALSSASGPLSETLLAKLRAECPGWDYAHLQQDFDRWIGAAQERTPVDYEKAFYGFVKRHHQRNRHRLQGC